MFDAGYIVVPLSDAHMPVSIFQPTIPLAFPDEAEARIETVGFDNVEGQPAEDLYENGFADGLSIAETRFSEERAALKQLVICANALQPESSEELVMLIGETVFSLVSSIVGAGNIDSDWLTEQAHIAVGTLRDCDNARTMRLHPDDAALLADIEFPLAVIVDADAKRGSIHIDCSNGWIESGLSIYLETLRADLGLSEVTK